MSKRDCEVQRRGCYAIFNSIKRWRMCWQECVTRSKISQRSVMRLTLCTLRSHGDTSINSLKQRTRGVYEVANEVYDATEGERWSCGHFKIKMTSQFAAICVSHWCRLCKREIKNGVACTLMYSVCWTWHTVVQCDGNYVTYCCRCTGSMHWSMQHSDKVEVDVW